MSEIVDECHREFSTKSKIAVFTKYLQLPDIYKVEHLIIVLNPDRRKGLLQTYLMPLGGYVCTYVVSVPDFESVITSSSTRSSSSNEELHKDFGSLQDSNSSLEIPESVENGSMLHFL